jgi:acyl carrier protein
MEGEDLRAAVRDVIGAVCPLGQRTVGSSDSLVTDLGYDSLALMELSLQLESKFSFQAVGDGETFDVVTVRDVEDLVETMIKRCQT